MSSIEYNSSDPYHIEDHKAFRDSILWTLQRNYFKHKGITAWQGEVPFYISSNALIAQRYAQWVIELIHDLIDLHPEYKQETFQIMELGAGIGKFSFYFLKALFENMTDASFKIRYVMTDMVEKNKLFWEENPYFNSLREKNCLEFAILDLEEEQNAPVEMSQTTPLIVIANYVFDCIKQDAFQLNNSELHEIQVGIKSRYKNYNQSKSETLKELRLDYRLEKINAPYRDPLLNEILKEYQAELPDSLFTMPISTFDFLNRLKKWTNNHYIMMVGDKGIAQMQEWYKITQEDFLSYEGCYAFMLNFDALNRYIKAQEGDGLLTENVNVFKVCCFSSKTQFSELKRASHFFKQNFERFGADEFCFLNEALKVNCYGFSLKALIGYLRLSSWDMDVYQSIHDRLIELVSPKKVDLSYHLINDINQVENNIYYYPGMANIYNQLGIFYQAIKQSQKAIELYQKALTIWGESMEPHHNLGMVYEAIGNSSQAMLHYQRSVALNSGKKADVAYARRRIQVLSGQSFSEILKIIARALFVLGLTAAVLYYVVIIL